MKNLITFKIRQKINKELGKLDNYFKNIPLEEISKILIENSLILIQEDQTKWEGFFCGREGKATIDIGNYIKDNTTFNKITNSSLILTWYKLESENYEIVCYLS